MESRISIVTLGVADMGRAIRFYRDGLGFATDAQDDWRWAIFRTAGTRFALYPRDALAEDARLAPGPGGFGGVTLAHNVGTQAAVDALLAEALAAGARVLKEPAETGWGGYSAYFADPDGYPWEIAWGEGWEFDAQGTLWGGSLGAASAAACPAGPPRMYGDLACYWQLVSPPAGYAAEAVHWRAAIVEALGPGRHPALELGVGGGNNLSHLLDVVDPVGVDLSPGMLRQCRRILPDVPLHVGDLRSVRLDRTFRAVLVHDAVSHLTTEDDLGACMATAAAHLEPDGIVILAPEDVRETFVGPRVWTSTRSDGRTGLTLCGYHHDPDPTDTSTACLLTWYLETPTGLRIEHDRLDFGLFPLATWLRQLEEAGFAATTRPYPVHEDGREAVLFVGRKRG